MTISIVKKLANLSILFIIIIEEITQACNILKKFNPGAKPITKFLLTIYLLA